MSELRKRPSNGVACTPAIDVRVSSSACNEPTSCLRCHLRAEEVPEWLHFPYIISGYRLGGTYWACACSLFVLHNECLNAWTMILGALLSTGSMVFAFSYYSVRGNDISAFVMYWTSLIVHLPFSVGYHLFLPISVGVYNTWRRLDMSFILMMSVQLTYGMSYFVYPQLWHTLMATALVSLASAAGIHAIYGSVKEGMPLTRGNVTRWIGLTAIGYYFPIIYQAVLDGRRGEYSVPFIAAIVVPTSLVGGAQLYELHIPERFFPGKLDLVAKLDPTGLAGGGQLASVDAHRCYRRAPDGLLLRAAQLPAASCRATAFMTAGKARQGKACAAEACGRPVLAHSRLIYPPWFDSHCEQLHCPVGVDADEGGPALFPASLKPTPNLSFEQAGGRRDAHLNALKATLLIVPSEKSESNRVDSGVEGKKRLLQVNERETDTRLGKAD
ncbi:hypothetical protein VOLCADRAFT_105620 [Volvox carteri f. nagariensis]|uniref:Uncharacterized protein n=1 Tax=Volvox carteri f. nagariensis TaxID=3068 RepID=D8U1X5_VOLCA|nr:uncharacterized protein VOLCADRAFT_105620 [Volvox carteri f. nagariensis]EFJ46258.1 hypothetical protein VOLCADRAFT_105620 [Volvox carteri f. nagariensis]|eukprot:XP_002952705.1 hypothetical protein VOLCADRAFT_105620 [Volvox carteri f. nagariensis]